jgi:hypothetical protein
VVAQPQDLSPFGPGCLRFFRGDEGSSRTDEPAGRLSAGGHPLQEERRRGAFPQPSNNQLGRRSAPWRGARPRTIRSSFRRDQGGDRGRPPAIQDIRFSALIPYWWRNEFVLPVGPGQLRIRLVGTVDQSDHSFVGPAGSRAPRRNAAGRRFARQPGGPLLADPRSSQTAGEYQEMFGCAGRADASEGRCGVHGLVGRDAP